MQRYLLIPCTVINHEGVGGGGEVTCITVTGGSTSLIIGKMAESGSTDVLAAAVSSTVVAFLVISLLTFIIGAERECGLWSLKMSESINAAIVLRMTS